jgi:excisionase family DNA binding protein
LIAEPIVAAPAATNGAATSNTDHSLRFFLRLADEAELALTEARKKLDEADLLIGHTRELIDIFPGTDEDKQRRRGLLADLVRRFAWLEKERARVGGRAHCRAPITADELAVALGWTRSKAYRWLDAGRIPGVTQPGGPGTAYLIPPDAVERMLAQDGNGKEE